MSEAPLLATPELLIACCEERMRSLAHRMLLRFPTVRRWDETDDVLQEASLRLYRALREVAPESDLHLYRLAALQIRRVLLDLARRYASRFQFAANHETSAEGGVLGRGGLADRPAPDEAASLDGWTEFHQHVGELPERAREAFDLMWYMGLSQEKAAEALGITVRSLQRRWRDARLTLSQKLNGEQPA